MSGTVASDSSVYYHSGYWNDLAPVQAYLNRRATGDPAVSWSEHLATSTGRTFRKALVLNCGNGWVERELVAAGLVKEAVGVDYAEDLLVSAREEAAKAGLPLRYAQLDTNTAEWPEDGFDLVINHAAAHHVACLDRVFRSIAELLPENGLFVSYDYLGPHRNQYPTAQWEAAWLANQALPAAYRHQLVYPHLPTMLVSDPTEAIHAELIMPVMRRYFEIEHFRALGGGVAYPVLTFNQAVFSPDADEVAPVVEQVLAADEAWTDADPEGRTLFGYVIAKPRKAALSDAEQLAVWSAEEDDRERLAAAAGGRYYPDTFLSALYEDLDVAKRGQAGATAERDAVLARLGVAEATAVPPAPAPPPSLLTRVRSDPRLRAAAKRVPGARPAVLALRRWRAARAAR
ncbi:MAG TPA: methyltransferase domain-containing protein [Mycobacteriales bacterium]|nr:methyltransferase domain-containing protein [Mycobacteriales bacterium]